jgi:hypothetical protein
LLAPASRHLECRSPGLFCAFCHLQHHPKTETDGPITIHYNKYTDGSKIGTPATLEVDMVIGADGANSRVAKEIDAGEYDYAIAFQERIRIPGESSSVVNCLLAVSLLLRLLLSVCWVTGTGSH